MNSALDEHQGERQTHAAGGARVLLAFFPRPRVARSCLQVYHSDVIFLVISGLLLVRLILGKPLRGEKEGVERARFSLRVADC